MKIKKKIWGGGRGPVVGGGGVRVDVIKELKFFGKFTKKKKKIGGGIGRGQVGWVGWVGLG